MVLFVDLFLSTLSAAAAILLVAVVSVYIALQWLQSNLHIIPMADPDTGTTTAAVWLHPRLRYASTPSV